MADVSNLPAIPEGRAATLHRATGETDIRLSLNLDGAGVYDVDTGNGFLDHMVSQISRHGLIDITLKADGDLHTGWHHLVEDVGITLGRAFNEAIGDARGIRRMGHAIVPLDETLAMVALDCSGRGYAVIETTIDDSMVETLPGSLVRHFFESFALEEQNQSPRQNPHRHRPPPQGRGPLQGHSPRPPRRPGSRPPLPPRRAKHQGNAERLGYCRRVVRIASFRDVGIGVDRISPITVW